MTALFVLLKPNEKALRSHRKAEKTLLGSAHALIIIHEGEPVLTFGVRKPDSVFHVGGSYRLQTGAISKGC
jgi:hypothetical protein